MKPWLSDEQLKLHQQIQQRTLPHAMIISGVPGSGKHELAQWLGQYLVCQLHESVNHVENLPPCHQCKACNLFIRQTHPDYKLIELNASTIGVDQIREVSRFFEKTAQLGNNQVVIVEDAEKMTESAANALLKTLEEPTSNSYLILLVNDEQRLMPTIISRCRHIPIRPPVGERLFAQLGQEKVVKHSFANLSQLPEMTNSDLNEQYHQFCATFIMFLYFSEQRMALVSQLIESKYASRWLEKVCVDIVRSSHQWLEYELPATINSDDFNSFITSKREQLWQVYQLICGYNKKQLTVTQFNKDFGIEKLMVDIQRVMAE